MENEWAVMVKKEARGRKVHQKEMPRVFGPRWQKKGPHVETWRAGEKRKENESQRSMNRLQDEESVT